MRGPVRIGISGWTYAPWRGVFYPRGLAQRRELEHASRLLGSIEINGTFYSLQRPETYARWSAEVPDDFVFAVKAPRFVTHVKRLKEVRAPVANFLASGVLRLGAKLGPILWQLPPFLPFDEGRVRAFLDLLPADTEAAAALARDHDARMEGRSWLSTDAKRPLRHALEVRHESFRDPRLFRLLEERGAALVVADTAGKWPYLEERTADFSYLRLHGDEELYVSGYTPRALDVWAKKVRRWSEGGRAVYAYFDNDVKVRAPYDAMSLMHRLGLGPDPGRAPNVRAAVRRVLDPAVTSRRWSFGRKPGTIRRRAASRRKTRT